MFDSETLERPDWASPPGQTILAILEQRELSVEEFAQRIGRSVAIAQKLLDGRYAIDREIAKTLSSTLGASERFWMSREYDYRAAVETPEHVRVTTLAELVAKLPVKDMENFGWIRATSKEDRVAECLTFFDVSTLAQWQGRYDDAFQHATYRKSAARKSCEVATTAWLRQGEIETQGEEVAAWSAHKLKELIPSLRKLTWFKSPQLFLPKVKELLALAGIKFTVVRAPKGCTASGAVRILANGIPHVQLSFRYLLDDQFWFSLFHEIGHLLLHFDRMPIVEEIEMEQDRVEQEANDCASEIIVPAEFREELYMLGASRFSIIAFAKKVGIAPGLIVGQLQHAGILRYNQMYHLKRRYQWAD